MPASIKSSEITWYDPIRIRFGFTGLTPDQAIPLIRSLLDEQWPSIKRYKQCVYIIRLRGSVAVSYNTYYSPVIYIGEGNAYYRLYNHASWISELLVSVQNLEIEAHVAQVARKNHLSLYQYIEADMLKWFCADYGMLPWFNRQRERSKESRYDYDREAELALRRHLGIGAGNTFLWAIRPLHNNCQYDPYIRGAQEAC